MIGGCHLRIHHLGGLGFDSNIFLIEDDHTVLIDCGTRYHVSKTLDDIKQITELRTIEKIILTHRHYDHTGGAERLQRETEAEVYIHREDAHPLIVGDSISTGARNFGDDMPRVEVKTLEAGDEIDTGEMKFVVIHTPGHSIGSIALYDVEKMVLFSGDTVFADGGVGRWDLLTGDLTQLIASVRLLSRLDVESLYPGHGNHVERGGGDHIRRALHYLMHFSPTQLLMKRVDKNLARLSAEEIVDMIKKKRVKELKHTFDLM